VEYPWSSSDIARKIRSLGHEKSAGKYTLDSLSASGASSLPEQRPNTSCDGSSDRFHSHNNAEVEDM
jgi:hypothetical protein